MALTVYPADNWDSFGTLEEVDTYITNNLISPQWQALDDPTKEVYCRQATALIKSCPKITLPDETSVDLVSAEGVTAVYALQNDVTSYDPTYESVTKEKVDVIEIQYDPSRKNDTASIPPYAQSYLEQYGCSKSSSGFSQTYAGRS